jgi:HrpA-like RNA helicase
MLLRRLLADAAAAGRPAPKLLLMSATADAELFAGYFQRLPEVRPSLPPAPVQAAAVRQPCSAAHHHLQL